ncbi:MAG: iron sulfur cluster assembly protein SufU [Gammaproteobacteria bacterium]|jgi:nitrogen fixation NifU-like protein|nr:iron sulfur cluster assembly protein SufU [Gammaproteobacteria bacterium]
MSDLTELYQALIIDHGRHPRNFCVSDHANCVLEGFNPLCGDRLTLYVTEKNNVIEGITFKGEGCAISMASASMMTEALSGKTVAEAQEIFKLFHEMVTEDSDKDFEALLGKLSALSGVTKYPARVKCATLSWHTLVAALAHSDKPVSTE